MCLDLVLDVSSHSCFRFFKLTRTSRTVADMSMASRIKETTIYRIHGSMEYI